MKIASVDLLPESLQQIRNVLMTTHKGIEDFTFRTQEDWAEQIKTFIHNARLSGGLIAGISLLVGGIGIMNIMLASISERVREIGIRKSVGAATGDIFTQILVESVVIAILGGLVGLVDLLRPGQPDQLLLAHRQRADHQSHRAGDRLCLQRAGRCPGRHFPGHQSGELNPIQALRYE